MTVEFDFKVNVKHDRIGLYNFKIHQWVQVITSEKVYYCKTCPSIQSGIIGSSISRPRMNEQFTLSQNRGIIRPWSIIIPNAKYIKLHIISTRDYSNSKYWTQRVLNLH